MIFTLRPTSIERDEIDNADFLVNQLYEPEIIALCRDNDWSGCHVYAGSDPEQLTYCGWVGVDGESYNTHQQVA